MSDPNRNGAADRPYLDLAYADPPYPGCAHLYPEKTEVDHAELIGRLERDYDGWALSTNAKSLPAVLRYCSDDVRVASWHVTNASPPGARGTWWWSWEPVIVRPARAPVQPVRNCFSLHAPSGILNGRITGEKPLAFCLWVFSLLGAREGDSLVDLFPGSGAVSQAWASFLSQPMLPLRQGRGTNRRQVERERAAAVGQDRLEGMA